MVETCIDLAGVYGTIPGIAGKYFGSKSLPAVVQAFVDIVSNATASGAQQATSNYCDNKPISNDVYDNILFGGLLGGIGHEAGHIYGSNIITKLDEFNAKAAPVVFPAATDYTKREIDENKKKAY